MATGPRTIELDVEVPGTPEEVWRAIATGPGISSWYVPHTVEEREGGTASASFGPEPEMTVPGRVVAWDPLQRVMFDGGEGVDGLAFEWLVEARDGGSCVVRLVNSGFGSGGEWDAQYDAMTEGWSMFLANLQLHLEHFSGQSALSMLPTGMWAGTRDDAWKRLLDGLGVAAGAGVGDRIELSTGDGAELSGVITDATPWRLSLLLDGPIPGTAFLAAEGMGDHISTSVWAYLYGPDAAATIERDEPLWRQWFASRNAG